MFQVFYCLKSCFTIPYRECAYRKRYKEKIHKERTEKNCSNNHKSFFQAAFPSARWPWSRSWSIWEFSKSKVCMNFFSALQQDEQTRKYALCTSQNTLYLHWRWIVALFLYYHFSKKLRESYPLRLQYLLQPISQRYSTKTSFLKVEKQLCTEKIDER